MSDFIYKAELVRVKDGDSAIFTIKKETIVDLDFGFDFKEKIVHVRSFDITIRLWGIDTAELRKGTKEQKEKAKSAKTELERLLSLGTIELESVKSGTALKKEKYGRYLAKIKITLQDGSIIDVNQKMIDLGYSDVYLGGSRKQ